MGKKNRVLHHSMIQLLFFSLCIFIMFSSSCAPVLSTYLVTQVSTQTVTSQIHCSLELPENSDYYIHFTATDQTLHAQPRLPAASNLSDIAQQAIAKSPTWIQHRLTSQFQALHDSEPYATLLLNAPKHYTDELAFSIACSPQGSLPSPDVLYDNVHALYHYDSLLRYADIIEYDVDTADYYSTLQYTVLDNGTPLQRECPRDIYYWYVVHPQLARNDAEYVYDTFWRQYLFNHNDLGYPLLQEKITNISFLWDQESYYQPANRLWNWSITHHPTAIETASYWVGKTVPAQAIGDRPNQPNIIAHEHNGWCGELQRIAVATQRLLLIPTTGACNVAEDHVWREFYDEGWHQNDNWWSDTGGAVNIPDVYAYGWGKNMSAIYAWRGDSSIYDITAHYIHPEDRITTSFRVVDGFLRPIDGARVTVVVSGLRDITWYKNQVLLWLQQFWDKLPEVFKGKIMHTIFDKITTKIDDVPDVIDGLIISTWNYSDAHGCCSFELGKNKEYLFIIQAGNLRKPWQLAKHNTFRVLTTHQNRAYTVVFADYSNRVQRHTKKDFSSGSCLFSVTYASTAFQHHHNVFNDEIGCYPVEGAPDFFVLDSENFMDYKNGKPFTLYEYLDTSSANITFSTIAQDYYFVVRNTGRATTYHLNLTITVQDNLTGDRVQIVSPTTTMFQHPTFTAGNNIMISGIASSTVQLEINSDIVSLTPIDGYWYYSWNTSMVSPGEYDLVATCGTASDIRTIRLIDGTPPTLHILEPMSGAISESSLLHVAGISADNTGVVKVEVTIDNETFIAATGTTSWYIDLDITGIPVGDHMIWVKAYDAFGYETITSLPFVINESGHTWGPDINSVIYTPSNPTNTSNIVVYANVTTNGPFAVKTVILYWTTSQGTFNDSMYPYANYPVQPRHEEDPRVNESNDPMYGFELGTFPNGEMVTYWIIATETAHNHKISDTVSFTVE